MPKNKLHRAYWLARYWTLDKYNRELRAIGFWAACVVSTAMVLALFIHVMEPTAAPGPQKAFAWIAYLVVLIISLILSYAMQPKPQDAKAQEGTQPITKDGRALRRAYGTNWIDDSSMVGWVNGSPEPIKSGGGKKGGGGGGGQLLG